MPIRVQWRPDGRRSTTVFRSRTPRSLRRVIFEVLAVDLLAVIATAVFVHRAVNAGPPSLVAVLTQGLTIFGLCVAQIPLWYGVYVSWSRARHRGEPTTPPTLPPHVAQWGLYVLIGGLVATNLVVVLYLQQELSAGHWASALAATLALPFMVWVTLQFSRAILVARGSDEMRSAERPLDRTEEGTHTGQGADDKYASKEGPDDQAPRG